MSDFKLVITDKDGAEVYSSEFVMERNKDNSAAKELAYLSSVQLLLHEASCEVTQVMQDVVDAALENDEVVECFIEWLEAGMPTSSTVSISGCQQAIGHVNGGSIIQCNGNLNGIAITSVNIEE